MKEENDQFMSADDIEMETIKKMCIFMLENYIHRRDQDGGYTDRSILDSILLRIRRGQPPTAKQMVQLNRMRSYARFFV